MDFDERQIKREHVLTAVKNYLRDKPEHSPAKSAFLVYKGIHLPAKYILRLAFKEVSGHFVKSEQLTGGHASVRVLKQLGFNAIYKKPPRKSWNKNKVKNIRRRAFKEILEKRFGPFLVEKKFEEIIVPGLIDRKTMDPVLRRILTAIEAFRKMKVSGRQGHKLAFDLFSPKLRLAIEFDENQHFTPLRAVALRAYPAGIKVGFDKKRWIRLARDIRAGDNSPEYRDEQRAFYDSIRDVYTTRLGLHPIIRIYENDVHWEKIDGDKTPEADRILAEIKKVVAGR